MTQQQTEQDAAASATKWIEIIRSLHEAYLELEKGAEKVEVVCGRYRGDPKPKRRVFSSVDEIVDHCRALPLGMWARGGWYVPWDKYNGYVEYRILCEPGWFLSGELDRDRMPSTARIEVYDRDTMLKPMETPDAEDALLWFARILWLDGLRRNNCHFQCKALDR